MNNPALPHVKTTLARCGASQRLGKGLRKNFPRFLPSNPLKSLDSDEIVRDLHSIKDLSERWGKTAPLIHKGFSRTPPSP